MRAARPQGGELWPRINVRTKRATAKVFLTRLNPLRSGLEMLIVGGLAAGVAYVVGSLLKNIGR